MIKTPRRALGVFGVCGAVMCLVTDSAQAVPCESLTMVTLPEASTTIAQTVAAGALKLDPKQFPPASLPGSPPLSELPAFCRVSAEITPTKDSQIYIEVWLPISGWNGKFVGVGNGGYSGAIWYPVMADALSRGYAAAGSDAGHQGGPGDASFGLGHPEKVVDFGYRAVHEMTLKAKALIAAFYGDAPRHSYWTGCSTGGRQGLTEAQRFPLDYDGIVAGAPVNFLTRVVASGVWIAQAVAKTPASYIPKEKYTVMHDAVLKACDRLDGLEDGVLQDPTRCRFDPKILQCKEADGPNCLTAAQVEAAEKIYSGPRNPRTGEQIFPGLEPGSELEWNSFFAERREPFVASHLKHLVFDNPGWDFRSFNFDSDVALADTRGDSILNATDPNLKEFVAHGGKLLLYHGWSDPGLAPMSTVNYYRRIVAAFGKQATADASIRLFMIPGQYHCAGGLWLFDALGVMDQWIEHGKPPDRIIASHFKNPGQVEGPLDIQISRWSSIFGEVDSTRPLCPYPQIAKYTGKGSPDDATNFVCTADGGKR
jgi:Tannase and feruloyl esterase